MFSKEYINLLLTIYFFGLGIAALSSLVAYTIFLFRCFFFEYLIFFKYSLSLVNSKPLSKIWRSFIPNTFYRLDIKWSSNPITETEPSPSPATPPTEPSTNSQSIYYLHYFYKFKNNPYSCSLLHTYFSSFFNMFCFIYF